MKKLVIIFLLGFVPVIFSYSQMAQVISKPGIHDLEKVEIMLDSNIAHIQKQITTNYNNNKQLRDQKKAQHDLEEELKKSQNLLKEELDYTKNGEIINTEIQLRDFIIKGIYEYDPNYLTERNLTATVILLKEIIERNELYIKKIGKASSQIYESQKKIDSLSVSESLFTIPSDSIGKSIYAEKSAEFLNLVVSTNQKLNNALDSLNYLEMLSNSLNLNLKSDIAEINRIHDLLIQNKISETDLSFIDNQFSVKFTKSLTTSMVKLFLAVGYYLDNNKSVIVLLLLFFVGLWIFIVKLKNKYIAVKLYSELKQYNLIFRRPVAVALLISFTVSQFFIAVSPFIITGINWILSGLALTYIYRNTDNKFEFRIWLAVYVLSLFAIFENLILIKTPIEKTVILLLIVFSSAIAVTALIKRKLFDRSTDLWITVVMLIFEIPAAVFLFTGQFNMAKLLATSGIYTSLICYLIIYAFKLTKIIFNFSTYLIESEEERSLDEIGSFPKNYSLLSIFFFVVGWFLMILRGTYFYPLVVDPLFNWLEETREIGALSFNFKQIILFFAIIFISAFISRIVALLSSENWLSATHTSKSGIGSRLILVRISITTIGIIIAIVSIGIPFDRVAIIISALGVGIGFGLQALINNLVSGIIIAVEKTVNVNDIVEIDGITGKMKSIGMRRSIVSTYDGSDVIIPNGDLMSKHLINWTMGNNRRRFEIVVGVAYGSDLENVKKLIEKVLTANNNVLKNPKPDIWITNFNSSSIDFSIKFWVNHFNIGFNVKSELMLEINKVFKANDIVIPFPQQDVYIKSEDLNPGKVDGD